MTSLTRIINKVSRDTGISKSKVKNILTKTFSQIQVNLEDDKNVMLRGFAKFVKAKRKTKQEETNWNKFKTKLK